jgi:hypothetical protein
VEVLAFRVWKDIGNAEWQVGSVLCTKSLSQLENTALKFLKGNFI